jgi:hypothetical protein
VLLLNMTRHAVHLNAEAPILRAMCLVVKSHRSKSEPSRQCAQRNVAQSFCRPDASVLNRSIPLFFIGRNKNGLWIAREAEGRASGIFLLKLSALHFAQKHSAPIGCATMFLPEPIELDTDNLGNPLARLLDAALTKISDLIPAYPPAIPIRKILRKGDWQ